MTSSLAHATTRPARSLRRRFALTIATLVAIGLAALLAYASVLRDRVVLAEVTGATGDLGVTLIREGERIAPAAATSDPDDPAAEDAAGGTPAAGDRNGNAGRGTDAEPGSGDSSGPGAAGTSTPTPTGVTIDAFTFSSGSNLAPGDVQSGTITLRHAGSEDARVRLDVTGIDGYDCFSYTARVGDAALDGTPSTPASLELGTWAGGSTHTVDVALRMDVDCTAGSGLSSNGSTSLADRHPGHASARLAFAFVAEGLDL